MELLRTVLIVPRAILLTVFFAVFLVLCIPGIAVGYTAGFIIWSFKMGLRLADRSFQRFIH